MNQGRVSEFCPLHFKFCLIVMLSFSKIFTNFLKGLLGAALLAVILIYFFNLNSLVSFGNDISKLQIQIKELEKQNQRLITSLTGQEGLADIQAKAKEFNMEPVKEVTYLSVENVVVVRK